MARTRSQKANEGGAAADAAAAAAAAKEISEKGAKRPARESTSSSKRKSQKTGIEKDAQEGTLSKKQETAEAQPKSSTASSKGRASSKVGKENPQPSIEEPASSKDTLDSQASSISESADLKKMQVPRDYVAFLRGINVSGARPVPMAKLRQVLEEVPGLSKISTLLQTGNVKFTTDQDPIQIQQTLVDVIEENFGFEVPVMVRSVTDLKKCYEKNPFLKEAEQDYRKVHFALCQDTPNAELVAAVKALAPYPQDEQLCFAGDCIYLHTPNGYGRAKVNNNYLEKKLDVEITCRNSKTIASLIS